MSESFFLFEYSTRAPHNCERSSSYPYEVGNIPELRHRVIKAGISKKSLVELGTSWISGGWVPNSLGCLWKSQPKWLVRGPTEGLWGCEELSPTLLRPNSTHYPQDYLSSLVGTCSFSVCFESFSFCNFQCFMALLFLGLFFLVRFTLVVWAIGASW